MSFCPKRMPEKSHVDFVENHMLCSLLRHGLAGCQLNTHFLSFPTSTFNKEPMKERTFVLTLQHLSLIQASLSFWRDEMSGCDETVVAAYFDTPSTAARSHAQLAIELLEQLGDCTISYALFEHRALRLVDQAFVNEHEGIDLLPEQRIVTVLNRR